MQDFEGSNVGIPAIRLQPKQPFSLQDEAPKWHRPPRNGTLDEWLRQEEAVCPKPHAPSCFT